MTLTDKIIIVKNQVDIASKIDLYNCSHAELDKLIVIANKQQKGIPRSGEDYQTIQNIADDQSRKKSVGRFS